MRRKQTLEQVKSRRLRSSPMQRRNKAAESFEQMDPIRAFLCTKLKAVERVSGREGPEKLNFKRSFSLFRTDSGPEQAQVLITQPPEQWRRPPKRDSERSIPRRRLRTVEEREKSNQSESRRQRSFSYHEKHQKTSRRRRPKYRRHRSRSRE